MVIQNRIGEFLADNPAGAGACYTFLLGEPGYDQLFARLFERAMHRAEFVCRVDRSKRQRHFRAVPYRSSLFRAAVRFFLTNFGVREVAVMVVAGKVADAQFVAVDLTRAEAEPGSVLSTGDS
jgi:hypothetical protein